MRIDVMTLFPEMMESVLGKSIIGKGRDNGCFELYFHNIRDFTANRQAQVDGYPYGGGMGMVMQADPLYRCLENINRQLPTRPHVILMSAQGKPYVQDDAKRLAAMDSVCLVCGHYEGVDERFIEKCVDEELSLGDFVLTGGEIAAMAICDSILRLQPGVLADESCFTDESHWGGLLEYPQYSRPAIWEGMEVPAVLLGGNHEDIRAWRRRASLSRTYARRPDILKNAELSREDLVFLAGLSEE